MWHTQISPEASSPRIRRRVSSASAWKTRSSVGGGVFIFVLTNISGRVYIRQIEYMEIPMTDTTLTDTVKDKYGAIARKVRTGEAEKASCCGPTCCGGGEKDAISAN